MWPDGEGVQRGPHALGINVQVKSGSGPSENDTSWGYRLEVPHFNFLADPWASALPSFLFLVVVPKDWRQYATADPHGLVLRYAAYWHWLGAEDQIANAGNGAKTTVRVPKAHLLTANSLRTLVASPQTAIEEIKAKKTRAEAS